MSNDHKDPDTGRAPWRDAIPEHLRVEPFPPAYGKETVIKGGTIRGVDDIDYGAIHRSTEPDKTIAGDDIKTFDGPPPGVDYKSIDPEDISAASFGESNGAIPAAKLGDVPVATLELYDQSAKTKDEQVQAFKEAIAHVCNFFKFGIAPDDDNELMIDELDEDLCERWQDSYYNG